jgi:hypothetical protein
MFLSSWVKHEIWVIAVVSMEKETKCVNNQFGVRMISLVPFNYKML